MKRNKNSKIKVRSAMHFGLLFCPLLNCSQNFFQLFYNSFHILFGSDGNPQPVVNSRLFKVSDQNPLFSEPFKNMLGAGFFMADKQEISARRRYIKAQPFQRFCSFLPCFYHLIYACFEVLPIPQSRRAPAMAGRPRVYELNRSFSLH